MRNLHVTFRNVGGRADKARLTQTAGAELGPGAVQNETPQPQGGNSMVLGEQVHVTCHSTPSVRGTASKGGGFAPSFLHVLPS